MFVNYEYFLRKLNYVDYDYYCEHAMNFEYLLLLWNRKRFLGMRMNFWVNYVKEFEEEIDFQSSYLKKLSKSRFVHDIVQCK